MHATIRLYRGNAKLADALSAHESEVRDVIGGIEGFRAYYLLKTADGAASVSVFDSQSAADESSRVAAAWLADNLPDLHVGTPDIVHGTVVIAG
jgi:hypothetical protein